ncbi:glutathione S-transferase family protein [Allohahella marinimesophila]|uniref:Glutathione S-transferase family protein n=1 Tax=Allohahella marinimesophila TaxID=1054972 RepID=A0ABP7NGS0_9GAMM
MKIYWFKAQAPRRVVALAKHLGIEAKFVWLDVAKGGLQAPDYKTLNPNMKAPTLVDGELVLWESSAIMAHLCIKAGSEMWPASKPAEQVELLRWLSWNEGHWSPVVGQFYFEYVIKPKFKMGPPNLDKLEAKRPELEKFAGVLNTHLAGRHHIAFDRLTIADFSLASMACHWREADMRLEQFSNIVAWLDSLDKLPAWAEPWPADA